MPNALKKWLHEVLAVQTKGATVELDGVEASVQFDGECLCLWSFDDEPTQLARIRLVSEEVSS